MESIQQAYKNPRLYKFDKEKCIGKVIGLGKNEVLIESYFKELKDGTFCIKTAYPCLEK